METENQSEFSHGKLGSKLGFLLLAGWRQAQWEFSRHFKDIDITPASFGVLQLVQENPGCGVGQVGRAMGIAPNNIARMVDQLCKRGLISKEVSPTDGRGRILTITSSGTQFLESLNEIHQAYEKEFHEMVGEDRVDALRALLKPFLKFELPSD